MSDEQTYDDTYNQIECIDFDIWGNDQIKRSSVLGNGPGIEVPDLYDNGEPKKWGLIDPRLGPSSHESYCAECGLDVEGCVGHFGHIDLAEVIFHIGYANYVHKILSCICPRCAKLLIHKNEDEIKEILKTKFGKDRMTCIRGLSKNVTYCQYSNYGCGVQIPKIKLDIKKSSSSIKIIAEFESDNKDENEGGRKTKHILTPETIYDILKNISDEDCKILGMDPSRSRPEDMVQKVFPVPPVPMRPSTKGMGESVSGEDDLTHKLADIIKANTRVLKNKENHGENNSKFNNDHAQLLQYHGITYMDVDAMPLLKNDQKAKPFKSITSRIKSKSGRVRNNLMGKRGDFTGRTVITCDPAISINQLGVPVKMAMNLTFPETVTPYNIDELQKLVKNGRNVYPGANFVFPTNINIPGKRTKQIDLRFRREGIDLHYGDIVERHLKDGDIVLLNRQPTLHKQNMMGHYIKIINNPDLLTFRLSVTVTAPYNADFDGDEMNIFVPQSLQTQVELEEIASVEKQLIDPGSSKPVFGIVQDGLLGSYNLTSSSVRIDWRTAMNIMSYTSLEDFKHIKKQKKEYTGAELFSLIIPSGINMSKSGFVVKDGNIVSGQLSKKSLGKQNNNLIQLIWDAYGVDKTRKFCDDIQRLVNNYNLWNGFSVGIGDTFISENINNEIKKIFESKELKVEHIITEIENNPNLMKQELYEFKLLSELNIVQPDVSKIIMNNMGALNAFHIMYTSGSKGDPTTIGNMCGCLGLQQFEGTIIPKKYNKRTSIYFHQNDDRGPSRGLIDRSFVNGLEYSQYVFHMMAARSGTIDQAVKTAETGYTQRKLIKSMEDVMIKYDNTVRNANNSIIQFVYGDSGADTTRQYEYTIKMVEFSNQELENEHKFSVQELKEYKSFSQTDNNTLYENIKNMRDAIRINTRKAKIDYVILMTSFMIPINLNRIIDTIIESKDMMESLDSKESTNFTPKYIIDSIEKVLLNNMTSLLCMTENDKNDINSLKNRDEKMHKIVLRTCLYDALSPKKVLLDRKINKKQFDNIIVEIGKNFNKNIVESGEMAGIIAAQSIGEPLTQMTLNAFHHIGVTLGTHGGVQRIKELLSISKKPKISLMQIYFTEKYTQSKEMAHKIASHIRHTTLKEIRGRINVHYDPYPNEKDSIMKNDNIKNVFHHNKGTRKEQTDIANLPWLIRIELNKEKMLETEVVVIDIVSKFCSWWEKRFSDNKQLKKEEKKVLSKITQMAILSNTDNDKYPVIHIRFNAKDMEKDNFDLTTIDNFIDYVLDPFKLKGINKITNVDPPQEERVVLFNNETGEVDGKTKQYVVQTTGVNLIDIRYLNGIDLTKTLSNNVLEMYEIFGIEIARAVLLKELTIAYERSQGDVNYQHISIIVDQMTSTGQINSIDRHGMNKSDNSPLSRASFEKTIEQLLIASVYAETDHINSVSSKIMVGSVFEGGTGLCCLELDTEMIENSEYLEITEKTKKFTEINTETQASDIINKKEKGHMFIPFDE
jgi:DNA-directed RNA polymerase II subunit RPB1